MFICRRVLAETIMWTLLQNHLEKQPVASVALVTDLVYGRERLLVSNENNALLGQGRGAQMPDAQMPFGRTCNFGMSVA